MGTYCLMGTEFHYRTVKKFWRWLRGDGNTTMRIYLVQLTCSLKMVKGDNVMLRIFYHNRIVTQKKTQQIWYTLFYNTSFIKTYLGSGVSI